MKTLARRLPAIAAGALILAAATGCHYDYGYYNVGYSYGYDCSPHYHTSWSVGHVFRDYGSGGYTGFDIGYGGHHGHYPAHCDY